MLVCALTVKPIIQSDGYRHGKSSRVTKSNQKHETSCVVIEAMLNYLSVQSEPWNKTVSQPCASSGLMLAWRSRALCNFNSASHIAQPVVPDIPFPTRRNPRESARSRSLAAAQQYV